MYAINRQNMVYSTSLAWTENEKEVLRKELIPLGLTWTGSSTDSAVG